MKAIVYLMLAVLLACCTRNNTTSAAEQEPEEEVTLSPSTVGEIPLPDGFARDMIEDTTSFAYYLRSLPLKPLGTQVMTYDGKEAWTTGVAYAVIDGIDTGKEDLQQCADAIIRLRAEWLYKNKRYDEIAFHFTNGWLCEYKRWAEGERVSVNGNKTSWYKAASPDYSYATFRNYLKTVFTYAGTLSLSKELNQVAIQSINIGDVFIQGGSPGHAIIVVDIANDTTWHRGDKCFIVAESYMPAQDIHILMNINNDRESVSPWHLMYDVMRSGEGYNFASYTFSSKELKRF